MLNIILNSVKYVVVCFLRFFLFFSDRLSAYKNNLLQSHDIKKTSIFVPDL